MPSPVAVEPLAQAGWARRKHEVRVWQRTRRKQLKAQVHLDAEQEAAALTASAHAQQQTQQSAADEWWQALQNGEPAVLTAALLAAFDDNPAPVSVVAAAGDSANLVVHLPSIHVLPAKKAHVTPTGRLSSKAWTKTELNEVYAELLGAHLTATLRETWAVAPSLQQLTVIGDVDGKTLFNVKVDRAHTEHMDDHGGRQLLDTLRGGLVRTGRAGEVIALPNGA